MPISSIDDLNENHWNDVKQILSDSIEMAGFEPLLVSESDDIGVIHKRIFQNLYELPVVVCDVSCNNPNVMYELGMRIAFDKGVTIIIKDRETPFAKTFDTAPIEQLTYPRDLRHNSIEQFKNELSKKIKATWKSFESPSFVSILRSFGEFQTVEIPIENVSSTEHIIGELARIEKLVRMNLNYQREKSPSILTMKSKRYVANVIRGNLSDDEFRDAVDEVSNHPAVEYAHAVLPATVKISATFSMTGIKELLEYHGIPGSSISGY